MGRRCHALVSLFLFAMIAIGGCDPPSNPSLAQDAGQDLPSHCTGKGSLALCKGSFSAGSAQTLCPSGYGIAGNLTGAEASLVGGDVGGFFASKKAAYHIAGRPADELRCVDTGSDKWGLFGVGTRSRSATVATYAPGTGTSCEGFAVGVFCDGQNGWSCPGGDINKAANSNSEDGVVCRLGG